MLNQQNFNRVMVNLWVALCRGDHPLPLNFRNLNYVDRFIEPSFSISPVAPATEIHKVNPELIISSSQIGHTILFEWKSGKNADEDQLKRYSLLKRTDLTRRPVSLELEETVVYDVVYVALEENSQRIRISISKIGHSFPLLVVSQDGVKLDQITKFSSSPVNEIFDTVLQIPWNEVPSEYMPIDSDSPDSDIAERVIPRIVEAMVKRLSLLRIDDICSQVCYLTWSIMQQKGREQIEKKVRNVVKLAAQQHFKDYLRMNADSSAVLIYNNPLPVNDRRTHQFDRLLKLQEQLFSYLRTQDSPVPENGQLSLFANPEAPQPRQEGGQPNQAAPASAPPTAQLPPAELPKQEAPASAPPTAQLPPAELPKQEAPASAPPTAQLPPAELPK